MAKYTINKHGNAPRRIEASHYRLSDGFFDFFDNGREDNVVLTYKAENVVSIWQETEAAQ